MKVTISSVPRSQLLITFSIAGVQLVATVVWCLVHLPGMFLWCFSLMPYLDFDWTIFVTFLNVTTNLVFVADIQYDYPTRAEVILKCNINDAAFVISQGFC